MIPVEYYSTVYYIGLSVIVLMMVLPLINYSSLEMKNYDSLTNNFYSAVLLLFTILFIGLRDPMGSWKYLGDTSAYTAMYMKGEMPTSENSKDIFFDWFLYLCSQFLSVQFFYLFCAVLYVFLPYLAFKKWFGNRAWLALLVYVTAMSFWAFGINGLRNGLAAAFFIYGISYIKVPLKLFFWFLCSFLFHKSMALPIVAFFLAKYIKNTKLLIVLWGLSIPIAFMFGNKLDSAITSFFQLLNIEDSRTSNLYVDEIDGAEMSRAFRLDFILYSAVAIVLGGYYIFKRKFFQKFYIALYHTYLISNMVWIIMIYAAYTNRIAYLSWFIMPLILVFPLLTNTIVKKQMKWIFFIILGSLSFTLLMFFK